MSAPSWTTGGPRGGRARPVSLYVLDDHALLRRGLIACFEEAGGFVVVGEAGTVREALRAIPALRPDVALLDVRLPDGSGVDVCRVVRAECPSTRVVMLTGFDDSEAHLASALAGAAGFVLKDVQGAALCAAVRRVAAGEPLTDAVAERIVVASPRTGHGDPRMTALTGQERRVLSLLGEGLSNREIADELRLTERTARNYVSTVLQKLGFRRRSQAGIFAATRH